MKILFSVNELNYTCGVTNHILNLTGELSKHKDILIYIICGGGNGIDRFSDPKIEVLQDRKFLHKNRSLINYLSSIIFLVKFVKKNKINIIHSHSHYSANIAYNASKLTRVNTIQTNHGILAVQGMMNHLRAHRFISVNEHIYNYIINQNITDKKNITLIRCGIPIPDKLPEKDFSKIKIIAASRFTYEKGLDIYIKAVSKLPEHYKTIYEFCIAGEGELEKELKKLNDDLNTRITFLGRVMNIKDIFEKSHILVYPSRSRTEGFPAVITEAAAYNNLIITSDFWGLGSVLKDSIDGLIFEVNNYENLSAKIKFALDNHDNLRLLSVNFYRKVKEMFNF